MIEFLLKLIDFDKVFDFIVEKCKNVETRERFYSALIKYSATSHDEVEWLRLNLFNQRSINLIGDPNKIKDLGIPIENLSTDDWEVKYQEQRLARFKENLGIR